MNVFSILKALKAPSSIRRNDIGQLCQGTMNFIELNQLALNEGMLKKKVYYNRWSKSYRSPIESGFTMHDTCFA